jgi:hypothetical protein
MLVPPTNAPKRRMKANLRYVVTNFPSTARWLYDDVFCTRGDSENRNQLRGLMTATAYVLYQEARWHLRKTELRGAHVGTIRLALVKLAARVVRSVRLGRAPPCLAPARVRGRGAFSLEPSAPLPADRRRIADSLGRPHRPRPPCVPFRLLVLMRDRSLRQSGADRGRGLLRDPSRCRSDPRVRREHRRDTLRSSSGPNLATRAGWRQCTSVTTSNRNGQPG